MRKTDRTWFASLPPLLGVFSLLAAFAASPALAQDAAQRQTIDTLRTEIATIGQRDGENAESLIEPLTNLGRLYRENGDHLLAQAAFQNALDVMRVNRGLRTLDQAPLVRLMIANAEEGGDARGAWDLEQGLLDLAERYPDAPETARILRDTGDRRVEILRRYNAGEFPPEIVLGCYYAEVPLREFPSCTAGTSTQVRWRLQYEAQFFYAQAVRIALQNAESVGDEIPALLTRLVEFGGSTLVGRSLSYLLAYQEAISAPWLQRIETRVQIADWDLLNSTLRADKDAALAEYTQAYELAKEQRISEQDIEALFSPDTPVVLPTFWKKQWVSQPASASEAYIDASFQLDKYGKSSRVKILAMTDESDRIARKRLERWLMGSQFRPRLEDGRPAEKTAVAVRYYSTE